MPGPLFLEGDLVDLHVLEMDDLPYIQELINDPDVWRSLHQNMPLSMHQEEAFFERAEDDDSQLHLLICREGDPVGMVGMTDIDRSWGNAEIGYYVDPVESGQGYATEAVGILVPYAFDHLRLHKLEALVLDSNTASRRVLEKNGFEEEGHLRDHAFIDGTIQDVYILGLAKSAYSES